MPRYGRPGSEVAFEYTRTEPPLAPIRYPGRNPAMMPNQRAPVSEQRRVLYSQVCRVLLQAAFGDRFVPTLELANDVVLGDAGRTNELGARRGSAQFSGDFPNGPRDLVFTVCFGWQSPRPNWLGSGFTCFCTTEHETHGASRDAAAQTQVCSSFQVAACSGISRWCPGLG